jgi:hypothetical protein
MKPPPPDNTAQRVASPLPLARMDPARTRHPAAAPPRRCPSRPRRCPSSPRPQGRGAARQAGAPPLAQPQPQALCRPRPRRARPPPRRRRRAPDRRLSRERGAPTVGSARAQAQLTRLCVVPAPSPPTRPRPRAAGALLTPAPRARCAPRVVWPAGRAAARRSARSAALGGASGPGRAATPFFRRRMLTSLCFGGRRACGPMPARLPARFPAAAKTTAALCKRGLVQQARTQWLGG